LSQEQKTEAYALEAFNVVRGKLAILESDMSSYFEDDMSEDEEDRRKASLRSRMELIYCDHFVQGLDSLRLQDKGLSCSMPSDFEVGRELLIDMSWDPVALRLDIVMKQTHSIFSYHRYSMLYVDDKWLLNDTRLYRSNETSKWWEGLF
jgi:hypothetical protein